MKKKLGLRNKEEFKSHHDAVMAARASFADNWNEDYKLKYGKLQPSGQNHEIRNNLFYERRTQIALNVLFNMLISIDEAINTSTEHAYSRAYQEEYFRLAVGPFDEILKEEH